MARVLLINPPFNITKAKYDSSISVGLLSIGTYLDSKGYQVKIIDCARQSNYLDLIKAEAGQFDYVGLSVMTTQIPGALQISQLIRQLNPSCKIVWGGTHPTFFPEQTAAHDLVDIVCFGEGEEVMLEIASGKNPADIKGIAYKSQNQIKINPPQELHDPAKIPLFNWNLVASDVLENLELIPSLTSRGCPHRCTFCINAILKNKWRPRTVEQVLSDLKIIRDKPYFAGKKLRFWDENFFVDIERAKAIIEGIIFHNLIISWETTVRANYLREGMISDNFLEKMRQSGCYLLSFGAESGSPRILKKIQKDITTDEIVESAKMCLRHDIIPQYSFMIGLPDETEEDMMMTLHLIDRLVKLSDKVQILGPQAFRPYPGSVLYEECLRAGLPSEASAKGGWQAPQSLEEWSHLVQNELNYLAVKNFPWVANKDFVESMEAYVRFGAHSLKSAMGSSVKAQKLLKLGFVLLCQARWKLKFFTWPLEFKLAKKFITKQHE